MEDIRAQIKIANERIKSSLQSAGIGTWNFNAANNTITLDTLARELYGIKGGTTFPYEQTLKNIHPDDVRNVYQSVTDCLVQDNDHQCDIRFRVLDTDNEIRWLQCTGKADFNDNQTVKHFDGIVRNITKEVAGIEEQRKLQIQKDNFLSIASHELKTPVTSIKAYAQLLEKMLKREGETQKADMMTRLTGQVNRLTTLLDDLLDVSKITNQRLNFRRDYHVFNDIVNDNVSDLDDEHKTHHIDTELGFMGSIFCDRVRIGQVLKNLISNAIKYSPDNDRILITTKQRGSDLLVCVTDYGIGISEENKGRVFEQFYRVSNAEAYSYQGMGLGLFISAEIIRQEGGEIWIESEENKGSTFCFSLPLVNNIR
jgi:signal transduction histidine kinase